jgi:hypothetical protein
MSLIPGFEQIFKGRIRVGRLFHSTHKVALTALAGGGQTGAAQAIKGLNNVGTVATTADSVMLPQCEKGAEVILVNNGAQSMTVYTQETSGVNINATAGSTGVAQAAGKTATYYAVSSTQWNRLLSA